MLEHIPTHLIAGGLGAGKTSLIRHLLRQRPAHERWAVLINEFGLVGLDAALLGPSEPGVTFSEVAGGCLCCVNGVPFQVGLGRLLRKARPQRLFIEPSGLGHPGTLLAQLGQPPWAGVLALQPVVMVIDAPALAAGAPLPDSQRALLDRAGLLVLNKAESLNGQDRQRLIERLAPRPLRWVSQGALALDDLPVRPVEVVAEAEWSGLPAVAGDPPGVLWRSPDTPVCLAQARPEGWSIGWRWHPSQRFDWWRVQRWLAALPWRRAKMVLRTDAGWLSANAQEGQPLHGQDSAWRQDSRLELIFVEPREVAPLRAALDACRL